MKYLALLLIVFVGCKSEDDIKEAEMKRNKEHWEYFHEKLMEADTEFNKAFYKSNSSDSSFYYEGKMKAFAEVLTYFSNKQNQP